ncbi:hypothetical protein B0H14DRAFT_3481803 [Mycena olivaceomarginata]|nr:hypothetical protein B0H14DRAFT_3481803 [Mycena olivaceomarginata]
MSPRQHLPFPVPSCVVRTLRAAPPIPSCIHLSPALFPHARSTPHPHCCRALLPCTAIPVLSRRAAAFSPCTCPAPQPRPLCPRRRSYNPRQVAALLSDPISSNATRPPHLMPAPVVVLLRFTCMPINTALGHIDLTAAAAA